MRGVFVLFLGLAACSSGSGVDSGKALSALSDQEYSSVCNYYNTKAKALIGQKCGSNNQTVSDRQAAPIACGTTNVLLNSSCPAKVGDVEACINSTDACVAVGANAPSGQCLVVNNCFPNR